MLNWLYIAQKCNTIERTWNRLHARTNQRNDFLLIDFSGSVDSLASEVRSYLIAHTTYATPFCCTATVLYAEKVFYGGWSAPAYNVPYLNQLSERRAIHEDEDEFTWRVILTILTTQMLTRHQQLYLYSNHSMQKRPSATNFANRKNLSRETYRLNLVSFLVKATF